METITIDSRTLIIKTDAGEDLPGIIKLINQKSKNECISSFLDFVSRNRIEVDDYKFNREDCYGK